MSQSHARPGAAASRGQLCAAKAPGRGGVPTLKGPAWQGVAGILNSSFPILAAKARTQVVTGTIALQGMTRRINRLQEKAP